MSNLYLVAILRSSDKTVLSTLTKSREVTVEGVRETIATANIVSGKRYTSQGPAFAIHYIQDAQGRVYSIVTSPNYPSRVVFSALDELSNRFSKEFGPRCISATENSLSKISRSLLEEIASKYADPSSVDKLVSVQEKLDVVKTNMRENIAQILQNTESIERIEAAAIHLNEQAIQFHDGSKSLATKMFWKKWKMRLLIGGLVIAILIIIIVPIAVSAQSSSSKK